MASSLPSVLEDNVLLCHLCNEVSTHPTLLPCLHFFCRLCLDEYIVQHATTITPTTQILPPVQVSTASTTRTNNKRTPREARSRSVDLILETSDGHGSVISRPRPANVVDLEGYEIPIGGIGGGGGEGRGGGGGGGVSELMTSNNTEDEYEAVSIVYIYVLYFTCERNK